ncbi:MAG: F0F1 ATP synthase subunit B [Candidatus Hinthialibacter antarcticus]|nr:F0F1 ATP synthase subunit B [Candidatus Hinthialibacter antarcticus]
MISSILQTVQSVAVVGASGGGPPLYAQIITHIVCFLIVFWILKLFAFGPIMNIIDERRNAIDADLKRAEDVRLQSEKDQEAISARLRGIEEESRQKMLELLNEGKRTADGIREKGHADAEALLEKARQNVQYEIQKAREELKADIVNMTIMASEHLIKERLDDEKQRSLIGDFLNRIERN